MAVNATGPGDWDDVLALAAANPDTVVPSLGVHPLFWCAHECAAGGVRSVLLVRA